MKFSLYAFCRAFLNGFVVALISGVYLFLAWFCFEIGVGALGVILCLLYLALLLFSTVYVSLRFFQLNKFAAPKDEKSRKM